MDADGKELVAKLCVSCAAVAKGESDKGIPGTDIIYCHPDKILTKSEQLVDFALLCFTPFPTSATSSTASRTSRMGRCSS